MTSEKPIKKRRCCILIEFDNGIMVTYTKDIKNFNISLLNSVDMWNNVSQNSELKLTGLGEFEVVYERKKVLMELLRKWKN